MLNRRRRSLWLQTITFMSAIYVASAFGAEPMSLATLKKDPAGSDQREVLVRGFLNFGREGDAICDTSERSPSTSCIEIQRAGIFKANRGDYYRVFKDRQVTFTAKFVVMPPPPEPRCPSDSNCVVVGGWSFELRLTSDIEPAN